jgi:cephalosporin hydroxylase
VKTIIDETEGLVIVKGADGVERSFPMASAEGFAAASRAWLRAGWDAKHVYSFTWLGLPIIQLPEDMVRIQELIHSERPDIVVETGVAHGGSLVFYASLFKAIGHGRVIGIDIDIRPHNRAAIEAHPLAGRIALIRGSSTAPEVLRQVGELIAPDERVMVVLDSSHARDHVLAELRAYARFIEIGGRMVVADGIMRDLAGAPRSETDWAWNNPLEAARAFVAEDDRFVIDEPKWLFNEGLTRERVTYWPGCYVTRVR